MLNRLFATAVLLASAMFPVDRLRAATELSLDELNLRWGANLDEAEVSSDALAPGLYVLRAAGGAIAAAIGEDGVLIVDNQYAKTVPKLEAEIRRLGGGGVDYVLNTHGHFDHADGNPYLAERGARIIAHENARLMLTRPNRMEYGAIFYMQPPHPPGALPGITFVDGMRLYFNGQAVSLHYFGPGHTDGDVVVFFESDNVLHVGDLYNARYPYIDPGNGGSLSGLIAICHSILDLANAESQIVSGHAPVATLADLQVYTDMLENVYRRLEQAARDGLTIDEVLAAGPTAAFDDKFGNPGLFLSHAYETVLNEAN